MKLRMIVNCCILVMIVSYSLVYFDGGDLNGFLIALLLGNALLGDLLFGIVPIIGMVGSFVAVYSVRRFVIFAVSFALMTFPLLIDVILYDRVVIENLSFWLPLLFYVSAGILSFLFLIKEIRTKQFSK
jgi:hypothetical protein